MALILSTHHGQPLLQTPAAEAVYYPADVRRGEYWGVWSIPAAILPSCQDVKDIAL